jgi:transcriptional repressor NrdR
VECPYCGADSRVLDSRASVEAIRRRRQCHDCGRRFTTYERVAPPEIRVLKRGGRVEPFDRAKLAAVVARLTHDRPVGAQAAADLVRGLEAELVDAGVQSVTSGQLADRLLARLDALDALAARRFASNYLQEDGSLRTADADLPSPQLALPMAGPRRP